MHLLPAVNWKVKGSSFHQSGMIWKFQLIPLILGKMSQMTSHHPPTIQMNTISDNLLNVYMNAPALLQCQLSQEHIPLAQKSLKESLPTDHHN